MKILSHKIEQVTTQKESTHTLHFEFMGKKFKAVVVNNPEITYVAKCYDPENNEIDIPIYFGTGFSHDIFVLILDSVAAIEERGK